MPHTVDDLAVTLIETMIGQKREVPPGTSSTQILDTMGPDGETARDMARAAFKYFQKDQ